MIIEYGNSAAIKIDILDIQEAFIKDDKVCFKWSDTQIMIPYKRQESFKSDHNEEILEFYHALMQKIEMDEDEDT